MIAHKTPRALACLVPVGLLLLALGRGALHRPEPLPLAQPRVAGHGAPATAAATVRAYATAFARGRYPTMWALLTPAARARWTGLHDYAAFYRAKFAPVRLQGFTLAAAQGGGTTAQVPLSLKLVWRTSGVPGVLSLFQNLAVTVARSDGAWRIADGGPLDRHAPIIPPTTPPATVVDVPILMYHHISNLPPLARSQVGLTVTDRDFAAQLAYLAAHRYHTVRLGDLFNALYYGYPLPPRPIVLTFDDGYSDNASDALPLLRRYGMVGVFNIITAFAGLQVGVNSYMTWAQIATLAAAGMECESHTIDHQDLGRLGVADDSYELRFSRGALAAHLHRAVQFLTYPSGEPFRSGTRDAQQRLLTLLPRFGYIGALLDQSIPSTAQDAHTPYQLPRIRVARDEPLAAFAARLPYSRTDTAR